MEIAFAAILISFVVSIFVAKLINYSNKLNDRVKVARKNKIVKEILNDYSIKNARIVNMSLSNRNSPVRPDEESFFDGIIKEISKKNNYDVPECKIMSIKNVVSHDLGEDVDGTL